MDEMILMTSTESGAGRSKHVGGMILVSVVDDGRSVAAVLSPIPKNDESHPDATEKMKKHLQPQKAVDV